MINLHVGDAYCVLEPVVPVEVTRFLSYWHKSLRREVDSETGEEYGQLKSSGEVRKLYHLKEAVHAGTGQLAQTLATMPGFAVPLRNQLEALGLQFRVIDERTKPPVPDNLERAFAMMRPYQCEGLYTLIQSRGGIMACPTGYGKSHVLGALIAAFSPESLMARGTPLTVVIANSKDVTTKDYHDLVEILPWRKVGIRHSDMNIESDDIMLTTPESSDNVDLESCGLLIYDEAHTITDGRATSMMRAAKALRYGFSATPTGRYDGADKVVTGVCGPIVYRRTYQQAIEDGAVVPIRVCWIEAPKPVAFLSLDTVPKQVAYRAGVWRNEDMHKLAAEILAALDPETQVLCVVDKIEHMNHIAPFLPEMTMVHAETSQKSLIKRGFRSVPAMSAKERQIAYNAFRDNKIKRCISTGIYRTGVNFPNLSVILNLEGLGSEIIAGQLPGRGSRNIAGKDMAYLVDFWHPWDQVQQPDGSFKPGFLHRDDMARQRAYAAIGFDQVWYNNVKQLREGMT